MNVVITKDDLLLFKYLFECKFLSREQIKRYIWVNKGKSYVTRRLWQLNKTGYILKQLDPLSLNKNTVLLPTEKALIILELHRDKLKSLTRVKDQKINYYHPEEYYFVSDKLDLRQYEHDKDMNTIRLLFEDYGANQWIPHGVLLRDKLFRRNPDGSFINNGYVMGIELEYNLKSKFILKKIFEKYRLDIINEKINYVLYITKTNSIAKSMLNYFNPQMIKNYVYVDEKGTDNKGKIIKEEKTDLIYKHFAVTTIDRVLNGDLVFKGNKVIIDLKDLFG